MMPGNGSSGIYLALFVSESSNKEKPFGSDQHDSIVGYNNAGLCQEIPRLSACGSFLHQYGEGDQEGEVRLESCSSRGAKVVGRA